VKPTSAVATGKAGAKLSCLGLPVQDGQSYDYPTEQISPQDSSGNKKISSRAVLPHAFSPAELRVEQARAQRAQCPHC
jgi:hypothetical protein